MKQILLIAVIFILSLVPALAQKNLIAEKYLKIKPIVFKRDDVEKLLGKRDSGRHAVIYQSTGETIRIQYSYGGCDSGNMEWGIPEWTVEEVFYVPRDEHSLRLRDVILDLSKFKKRQAGDVLIHFDYSNEEAGITVGYDKKQKIVTDITISPTLEQKKIFACTSN